MSYLYEYIDELLRLQSRAVEKFKHTGVLGDAREEFLRYQINERLDHVDGRLHKGEVFYQNIEHGQHDIILRRKGTVNPCIGNQVRICSTECVAIIEVKTNAKLTEIRDFERKSKQLKIHNENLLCGMFCYKINGQTSTVLARSGYIFDREYQMFEPDDSKKEYSSIDFIICLDDEEEVNGLSHSKEPIVYSKGFCLVRDSSSYKLFKAPPYSKTLFQEMMRADQSKP
ncbi:DUF6602 domain-containing protein [Vibrio cholerae]|uniref:DUF6602 domain-containing protein n=1 Tax=Vibrio TaxID=662 RepID=UPI000841F641|nr:MULTISPECIES: DUF6602 domain-containing protein [Vibrio]EJB0230095.1 hypothetical protein [Vibrio vulnificus]EGR1128609.1 hypothetical protein [Vibrio cholerae]EGR2121016.1 hypothetical protein [Vibrio cholerae]EGR2127449.1 hypothetical protein [Vibrio cholerae]EGS7959288.1 hypothetical protein [Vibrio cholerae]